MNWLEFNFKYPDWQTTVLRAVPELHMFIAAQLQTNRGLLFDAEGARNGGEKWKSPMFRNGMALSNRGVLRKSIGPKASERPIINKGTIVRFAGDKIIVGTNLAIARLMNDGTVKMPGGKMVPTRAKALKIPLPGGKKATESAKLLRRGATTIQKEVAPGKFKNERVIFRKSVKIPARPFDELTLEDKHELEVALANKIYQIVTRNG